MRRPFALVFTAALCLGASVVAALGWSRYATRREAEENQPEWLLYERVEYVVTYPPDYNARAIYGVEPKFQIRRRDEAEFKRRLEFFKPALRDAIQTILTRVHWTNLDPLHGGRSRGQVARDILAATNRILGDGMVSEVQLVDAGR